LAGYGLISEAVSPGFDFADMELGSRQKLGEQFPEHSQLFERLTGE
jgi:predicted cupin superfamily sugar epimerase